MAIDRLEPAPELSREVGGGGYARLDVDRIRFGPGALSIRGPNFAMLLRGEDLTTLITLANAAREEDDPLKITGADVGLLYGVRTDRTHPDLTACDCDECEAAYQQATSRLHTLGAKLDALLPAPSYRMDAPDEAQRLGRAIQADLDAADGADSTA